MRSKPRRGGPGRARRQLCVAVAAILLAQPVVLAPAQAADVEGDGASGGTGVAAAAGAASPGQLFTPVSPARVWDSRTGPGPTGRIDAGHTRHITVTGTSGIPATGVTAVVLNLTAVNPTAPTFVTAWPPGETKPLASNLNVPTGDVRPNLVVVKVGAAGQVSFTNAAGNLDLIADVAGWYGTAGPPPPAGALHATPDAAFVDAAGNEVRVNGLNVIPVWGTPGATWSAAKYAQIRSKGFNAVRFVLYWDDFELLPGVWNPINLLTLDLAISRAKAAGLHVVLDAIHLWGSGGFNDVPLWARNGDSVTTVQTNGGGYLAMLAARYRHEPAVIAYDLVNEFHRFPIDQNGVLRAYDSLITQVRAVDPFKIVIIEPTYGDTSVAGSLADFSNLTHRANVVWSIHDYFAGGDDDGYAADGRQTGAYAWDGTTGYATPNLAQLESHVLAHVTKMREVGIPIWVGELGIGEGAANHDQWIRDKLAVFDKYGLGRAWWEYRTDGPLSATNPDSTWKPWVDLLVAPPG